MAIKKSDYAAVLQTVTDQNQGMSDEQIRELTRQIMTQREENKRWQTVKDTADNAARAAQKKIRKFSYSRRFVRWIGRGVSKTVGRAIRGFGFPKAGNALMKLVGANSYVGRFLSMGVGFLTLKKLKDFFSRKKRSDPTEDGGIPEVEFDKDNIGVKEPEKTDAHRAFSKITRKRKAAAVSARSRALDVKVSEVEKEVKQIDSTRIDYSNTEDALSKLDKRSDVTKKLLNILVEQGRINLETQQGLAAQVNDFEESYRTEFDSYRKESKGWFSNLKEKVTLSKDKGKNTLLGWIGSTIGKIFTGLKFLGGTVAAIATAWAAPKIKEGWNWLKNKTKGAWDSITGTKSPEEVKVNESDNLEKQADDYLKKADVDEKRDRKDNEKEESKIFDFKIPKPLKVVGVLGSAAFAGTKIRRSIREFKNRAIEKAADKALGKGATAAGTKAAAKGGTKAVAKEAGKKSLGGMIKQGAKSIFTNKKTWVGRIGRTVLAAGKNMKRKIVRAALKTGLGKRLAKAGTKVIAKLTGGAGKMALKKIPLLGLLAGVGFAIPRAIRGDWFGAASEIASGVASCLPGIGTAASAAIDVGLLARDIKGMGKKDEDIRVNEDGILQSGNLADASDRVSSNDIVTSRSSSKGLMASTSIEVSRPKITTPKITKVEATQDTVTPQMLNNLEAKLEAVDKKNDLIIDLQQVSISGQAVERSKAVRLGSPNLDLNM